MLIQRCTYACTPRRCLNPKPYRLNPCMIPAHHEGAAMQGHGWRRLWSSEFRAECFGGFRADCFGGFRVSLVWVSSLGFDLLTMRVQRRVRRLMSGGSTWISLYEQSSSTCKSFSFQGFGVGSQGLGFGAACACAHKAPARACLVRMFAEKKLNQGTECVNVLRYYGNAVVRQFEVSELFVWCARAPTETQTETQTETERDRETQSKDASVYLCAMQLRCAMRARMHAHACTHTRMHIHTHARTHTPA